MTKRERENRLKEYTKLMEMLKEFEPFEILNLYIEAKTGVANSEHIQEDKFNECDALLSELIDKAKTKEVVVKFIDSMEKD